MYMYFVYSWHTFFLIFWIFLDYTVHICFLKFAIQISKNFPNIIMEQNFCVSGRLQFKPALSKYQKYYLF